MSKTLVVQWLVGGGAALVISAAVRSLPEPASNGSPVYLWAYRTIHAIFANWDKVGVAK